MPGEIPAVRILPMSDKLKGFRGKSIEEVQNDVFLGYLPAHDGRYHYQRTGLNTPAGTIVLFQFQARIIASAVFVQDEKFKKSRGGYGGILHFEAESFRTFEPVDADGMRKVWPGFRAFGHVKQALNPTVYITFKRRLKSVKAPSTNNLKAKKS